MREYVIVKTTADSEEERHEDFKVGLAHEKFAKELMGSEDFIEYVNKHGYHFSDDLATFACKAMENTDGSYHIWTPEEVKQALGRVSFSNRNNCTIGDLTYLANMAYADFYPKVIGNVDGCLSYAVSIADDPDGYEGMVFMRYLSDVIGKEIKVKWFN
jgi:hypothetical protein